MAAVLVLVLGGLLGFVAGHFTAKPLLAALLGGASAVAMFVTLDGLRGERLMLWLRGGQDQAAPRDAGLWGELGYRIEKALRQRERELATEQTRLQQFLAAIEASPNGVLLLDPQDRIDWCNRVAAEHFGLDPQRDRMQRVTNLVRAPAFVSFLQTGHFDRAVRFTAPSGRSTLEVTVRPYAEDMKLVLSQDITESERSDAMRRDFVANVSHEIRTPLTVLSGFVETMAKLPLSETEQARVLDLMAQQAQRMQALVADLLTLAQLEGSPRPAHDRWLDLHALMRRAEADGKALSAGRHTLLLHGGEGVELAGSETELLSALGNLVGNAVRYTPEGGRIDVQWRQREDGGGELSVLDTGPGIAREHIPRLTERFYRVDGSRSRDTGGTGLGLSIVKHVAQRHGGEIDIQSELGKGSSFRIQLPALRVRHRVGDSAPAAPVTTV
jgi:two-component system, OmpR family, phosphate regulon sensor histidine kinase PhoR